MLEVRGFNKKLECAAFESDSQAGQGLGHFLGLVKKPRVVPSGGMRPPDRRTCGNEDDILHIRACRTSTASSAQGAELLIYLTARICAFRS